MVSDALLGLKLTLERYYTLWEEQHLIVKEIENRGFLRRIIATITGEYGIAKIIETHFDEEIRTTIKLIKEL